MNPSDLEGLSAALALASGDVDAAIGGPWYAFSRAANGTRLWVGREGPMVAIEVGNDYVAVGTASGTWTSTHSLDWAVEEPTTVIPNDLHYASRLAILTSAVEVVVRLAEPQLVTCRFCNRRVAHEFAFHKDSCQSCASTHLGVVY